jgi:hypothetical protein
MDGVAGKLRLGVERLDGGFDRLLPGCGLELEKVDATQPFPKTTGTQGPGLAVAIDNDVCISVGVRRAKQAYTAFLREGDQNLGLSLAFFFLRLEMRVIVSKIDDIIYCGRGPIDDIKYPAVETNCDITYDATRGTQANKRRADAGSIPGRDVGAYRRRARGGREASGPAAGSSRARDRTASEDGG